MPHLILLTAYQVKMKLMVILEAMDKVIMEMSRLDLHREDGEHIERILLNHLQVK